MQRCWAVIPAAGISQRMGTGVPKQYYPLNNTSVIEISLSCFLQHPNIDGIVVALHKDDKQWHSLKVTSQSHIHTVTGGETRAQSVYAALEKCSDLASPDDFILVHDAARPCLRFEDLDKLISTLQSDQVGGILATPITDTVKEAYEDGVSINKTLDRSRLWKALTPQMFRLSVLKEALQYCFENNVEVTDEASAVEQLGLAIKLISGHSDNIKITMQEDIKLAEFILSK